VISLHSTFISQFPFSNSNHPVYINHLFPIGMLTGMAVVTPVTFINAWSIEIGEKLRCGLVQLLY
jgi:hypothetical protein